MAFFIFGFLEDNWEGMSGTYMGKNWSSLQYLFSIYEIENPKTIIYFMKMWEGIVVNYKSEKSDQKRKAEQRRSAGGGKNFTHNVKG